MLDNTITLNVDTLNNGTTTAAVYTRFDAYSNRSLYNGPDHTRQTRNTLGFYRTMAKPNGNYRGSDKSSIKFTQDVSVPGVDSTTTLTAPMIMEISFSVPVGVSSANQLAFRQRGLAAIDNDTLMSAAMEQLQI